MFYIWLGVVILLTIVECMTVNLTTIWFVLSGLISLVLSFFTDNFLIQFGVFVVLGIVLLITTRPILQRFLYVKKEHTNSDRVIGMQGVVTGKITPLVYGEVKVDGKKWTATSEEELQIDEVVTILAIDGVKLKVKKVEE